MLDTRYVHLHQALGLGVMWLQRNARVLPSEVAEPVPTTAADSVATVAPKAAAGVRAQSARLAALQKVGSQKVAESVDVIEHNTAPLDVGVAPPTQSTVPSKDKTAALMVLSVCAAPHDVAAGRLFSGEDGVLLYKMLAAIGLHENDVYVSTWLKDLPDFNPKPALETVQQAVPRLQAEYQACGAPPLLLLGDFFARDDVLEQVQLLGEQVRYFTIAHPMRIASNPALKRPAWETLQLLQQSLAV